MSANQFSHAAKLTPGASAHLDMIRGLSALAVLFSHIRTVFYLDHQGLATGSPLINVLYAVTGLSHEAVMVFFVLSGYLIGGTVLNAIERWLTQNGVGLFEAPVLQRFLSLPDCQPPETKHGIFVSVP